MIERVFLEDIGSFHSETSLGHARAWEIRQLRKDPALPPLIYVVESEIGQQFLLGRESCGRRKFNMVRYIAKIMVDLFFEQLKSRDLSQYLILRGAYPFDLQYAMGAAPPYDVILLPTGFIKLQRVLNREGKDWEIHAQPLIGEYRGETWLVPDTAIASGSTIAFFLRQGLQKHLPKQIYVFTACGSLEGIRRIYRECKEAGVELIPVFSQCIFEVSKTGNLPGLPLTDLSVMNSGSITSRDFFERASQRYQGTRLCCVGDIGESLEEPSRYSIHTLWEMQVIGMDPAKEDWDEWTINVRDEGFQKEVIAFNPSLFDYFKGVWKKG
jgi:uracil phosphoribosyltransferase